MVTDAMTVGDIGTAILVVEFSAQRYKIKSVFGIENNLWFLAKNQHNQSKLFELGQS